MEDTKYTVFGPVYQLWPLGSDKVPMSVLLDPV